jgi:hypothetical protein
MYKTMRAAEDVHAATTGSDISKHCVYIGHHRGATAGPYSRRPSASPCWAHPTHFQWGIAGRRRPNPVVVARVALRAPRRLRRSSARSRWREKRDGSSGAVGGSVARSSRLTDRGDGFQSWPEQPK